MSRTKWYIDQAHSNLGFKVKHLMITNISGSFTNFSASVEMEDDDFSTAIIDLKADIASINTKNEQRDNHLRSSDFFEAEKFPEMTFQSTSIKKVDNVNYRVFGDLTLKGVTKPVNLSVELEGVTKDPWGGERAGFVIDGKINRADWGINFNSVLESGNLMLSDEIRITSEVQIVKQPELSEA